MADKHPGYDTAEQKADQLAALKLEHEGFVHSGELDRAKQVAAYVKEYHGVSLSTPRSTAKTED